MKLFMCCSGEKSRSKDNSKDLGTGDPFNAGKQRRKAQHGHNARANLLLSCFGLVVYVPDLLQTFYGETGLMEYRYKIPIYVTLVGECIYYLFYVRDERAEQDGGVWIV